MDVSSHKAMIYPLQKKDSKIILAYIIEFCTNNIFDEYCSLNNIKFIHGIPYNPHAQGLIELFKYTIKKYLAKEYIANGKKNYNLIKNKVINFYNNNFIDF